MELCSGVHRVEGVRGANVYLQMVARPYDLPLPLIIMSNWLRLRRFSGKVLRRRR